LLILFEVIISYFAVLLLFLLTVVVIYKLNI
jgi:hypothetical protein